MPPLKGTDPGLDLAALRRRLAGTRGREYWRSLAEAAGHPDFARLMSEEFPAAEGWSDTSIDRRRLLQVMAACVALATVGGCGPEKTRKQLLPHIREPEGMVPAVPRFYATAATLGGFAEGVLVKHYQARPIKIEGNPDHPASLGATSHWSQALILSLYDPERSQMPLRRGVPVSEQAFVSALFERRSELLRARGRGLRILTGSMTSPTFAGQMAALLRMFPEARWHQWEAIGRDAVAEGAMRAFGRPLDAVLHVDKADVLLAVGSDLLSWAPGHLRYARDFAAKRRATETGGRMSRVYAIEATPTLAGSVADHRLVLPPDNVVTALGSLAMAVKAAPDGFAPAPSPWLAAAARDLMAHRGAALVHVGPELPAEAQVLAHAINEALGARGHTLDMIEPVAVGAVNQLGSLAELVRDMNAGAVGTLLILDVNPAFTAPADLEFAEALVKVPFTVHLGSYVDETASRCVWHLPATHDLEAWSDARAYDGTASIIQPQVRPLYLGRSAHEMVDLLQGSLSPDGMALVQNTWRGQMPSGAPFDDFWRAALRRGVVPGTAARPVDVPLRGDAAAQVKLPAAAPRETLTVLFRPDDGLWDGRFADNGYLQELPRWHTKLVWDNAALIAPRTAERLKLRGDDMIEIECAGRTVQMPVWILPAQAENCLTLPLGFGRRVAGNVGRGAGFDPYPLRTSDAVWHAAGVSVTPTGRRYHLVSSQHEQTMAGRDMVISAPLDQFAHDPDFLHKMDRRDPEAPTQSIYPSYDYPRHAWAMAVNLNSCVGCGACVVACAAENNTPVVGKEEADRGRMMHWLRIDRYYSGEPDAPDTYFQPVPCMHCEDAPCEVVCPVQATMHDSDGLNVMVYNRCVGTRFCSNNCPYKVRRFNFFGFTRHDPRLPEAWNPDVTVRDRGVMEKCTYCIQRIREAEIAADREDRRVREGEVKTACQAACPTQAIVFGDMNDKESAVAARKASPLDYQLLAELNTRPRTTYEAHLRNVNPELEEE